MQLDSEEADALPTSTMTEFVTLLSADSHISTEVITMKQCSLGRNVGSLKTLGRTVIEMEMPY